MSLQALSVIVLSRSGTQGKDMANKFPYVASAGPLVKAVAQLRKSFPKEVTADTLRKLGIAPKNESYVINVLRFLGVIDDEGKKVADKSAAFSQVQEDAFARAFEVIVRDAYEELFELHGGDPWSLNRSELMQFFRSTDHSSDVVGSRQASTFSTLAALSGHAELPKPKTVQAEKRQPASTKQTPAASSKRSAKVSEKTREQGEKPGQGTKENAVGLTVRIEVNLPASGDQETYDRIFRSIRANLIDGKA
jgi:hypothetical protein